MDLRTRGELAAGWEVSHSESDSDGGRDRGERSFRTGLGSGLGLGLGLPREARPASPGAPGRKRTSSGRFSAKGAPTTQRVPVPTAQP